MINEKHRHEIADTIELADGSRWVREKTCHVTNVEVAIFDGGYEETAFEFSCGHAMCSPAGIHTPRFCPWCGAMVVEKEEDNG